MMASHVMTSTLSSLFDGFCNVSTGDDVVVNSLSLDSRAIQKQSLFFSLARHEEQRIQHLEQALHAGSIAVACDASFELSSEEKMLIDRFKVTVFYIADLSRRISEISARFYKHPSRDMKVIAVTGTNGKTSVSQFIAQALETLGKPCGVIGTLGVGKAGVFVTTNMTTPDPITVQKVFADFKAQGIQHVVLEASSHALDQARLEYVEVDIAVLTNLSRDHLDYHGDMQHYAAAKKRLFEMPTVKSVVLNSGDQFGIELLQMLSKKTDLQCLSYNTKQNADADVTVSYVKTTLSGISFRLIAGDEQYDFKSKLLARFNVDNLVAAFTVLSAMGIDAYTACRAIEQCHAVAGRMLAYSEIEQPLVVIDFAHTPAALEDVLASLRSHLSEQGQLWCVFGCGGDRDHGKRPLMGRVAEKLADHCVLTSDNPRSELNTDIVIDIVSGMESPEAVSIEHDRAQAISYAIDSASSNDIVLVAGKGHEDYQEVAGIKLPFSDAEVVKKKMALQRTVSKSKVTS